MRIYDPRISKFISNDPLTKNFPSLTPYQFASNNPIHYIDYDGLEGLNPMQVEAGLNFIETQTGKEAMNGNPRAQAAFSTMLSAKFSFGAIQLGIGGLGGTTSFLQPYIYNITAHAATIYSTYSVATANIGAFTVELLNPDPNGTPGLEFFQGDEVARGLKLLFKQTAVPLVKPLEKFILNTSKFDYFFGKLEYQNLKGADLEEYAKQTGKAVENLIKNQDRASSMAKVLEYWGIKDSEKGVETLSKIFSAGLNGKVISSKVDEYGTSIKREISLIFVGGERSGKPAGSIQISYLYKNGDMNSTPEITSIIPIPDKK